MWRALVFLALLALAAYGAVWIADHPGTVNVNWGVYDVQMSLAIALTGVLVAAIVVALIWAIVTGVIGLPASISRSTRERRRNKGLASLSRGMIAVGSGDPLAARRHAGDAERLLGSQPLTLLLKAQAAQISGDRDAAERAFRSMADDPETRVLGLRGLFVEARRREDEATARAYAVEAARLAPSVTWANEAVMEAHCADGDWSAATETVERRASLGLMDKHAARRQRAVLLTAAAQSNEAGAPDTATEQALKAVKLAPDLVPAAVIAGRLLARRNDLRKAAKIVEAAWKATPHPELGRVYLNLRTGDSARDRVARAETLAKLSSWDPEARLVLAQAAAEAKEFGRARETLAPLLDDRPTVRVCRMMARIEAAEHGADSGRSREWLARAARAPRDPAWVADGVISERWAPISPATGRLDAFVWKTPPEILAGPEDEEAPAAEAAEAHRIEAIPAAPAPAAPAAPTPAAPTPAAATPAAPLPTAPPPAAPPPAKAEAAPASKPGFLETGAGASPAVSSAPTTSPATPTPPAIPRAPVPPGTPVERPRHLA